MQRALQVGQRAMYSVTVTNLDPSEAVTGVTVQIPNTSVLAMTSYSVPGGYCNIGGGATCFPGTLTGGASRRAVPANSLRPGCRPPGMERKSFRSG